MSTNPPEQPEPSEPQEAQEPGSPEEAREPGAPEEAREPGEAQKTQEPSEPTEQVDPQLPPMPPPQDPQAALPPMPPAYASGQNLPPMPAEHGQPVPQQVQYLPHPQYPPIPPGWQPPPPAAGSIWLGILLGAGIPILGVILGFWMSSSTDAPFLSTMLVGLPFWVIVITAIVLTVIRRTRRTGIGLWIGLASLPIIGFGVCVVAIFSY